MKKYITVLLLIFPALILQKCSLGNTMTQNTSTIKYLALGDSYTIGESIPAAENFPNQLAAKLKIAEPQIIAVTGWATSDLLMALAAERPANNFNLVTLSIGVNNQYQGKSLYQYKGELEVLAQQAILYAANIPGHIVMVSIPDYGVTPYAAGSDREKIARELDEYNAINKSIDAAYGLLYADITTISRQADPENILLAEDGLHPSGTQYKAWVDVILPMAEKVLGRSK